MTGLLRRRGGPVIRWGLLLLVAVAAAALAEESKVLVFGSYATERPSEEFHKMEPFRTALEQGLRERGQDYRVDVRIFPTYEEGVQAITGGTVDFARLGPANYVLVKQRNPALHLLAAEAREGRKYFSGLIIVPERSTIRTLADLRGRTMAFGDPTSTTGRYVPQAALAKAGITARDLAGFDYLGRHDKVVFAVASGTHDAGATNEGTFDKYAERRGLRALIRFPSPTQAWVARPGLDAEVEETLRATLFSLTGPALDYIDRNGFLPADDSDYEELRQIIEDAGRFGG